MKNKITGKENFADTYTVNHNDKASYIMIYKGIYQPNKYFASLYSVDGAKLNSMVFTEEQCHNNDIKYVCSEMKALDPKLIGRYDYIFRINNPLVIDSKAKAKKYIELNGEYLKYCTPELKSDEELVGLSVIDQPLNIMYSDNKYQQDGYSFIGSSNIVNRIINRVNMENANIADYIEPEILKNELTNNTSFLKHFFMSEFNHCAELICKNPLEYTELFDAAKIRKIADDLSDKYASAVSESSVIKSICSNVDEAKKYLDKEFIYDYIAEKGAKLFSDKRFWAQFDGDDLNQMLNLENLEIDLKKILEEHSDLIDGSVIATNSTTCFYRRDSPKDLDMIIAESQKQLEHKHSLERRERSYGEQSL